MCIIMGFCKRSRSANDAFVRKNILRSSGSSGDNTRRRSTPIGLTSNTIDTVLHSTKCFIAGAREVPESQQWHGAELKNSE
ncbi:hypothetical protein [Diadegma fenestrale ichnovirus]|nr:hypothetical protein [Diadegma fenestrale ichnovirus]